MEKDTKLLTRGADVNILSPFATNALMYAVQKGKISLACRMAQAGAKPSIEQQHAIIYALENHQDYSVITDMIELYRAYFSKYREVKLSEENLMRLNEIRREIKLFLVVDKDVNKNLKEKFKLTDLIIESVNLRYA